VASPIYARPWPEQKPIVRNLRSPTNLILGPGPESPRPRSLIWRRHLGPQPAPGLCCCKGTRLTNPWRPLEPAQNLDNPRQSSRLTESSSAIFEAGPAFVRDHSFRPENRACASRIKPANQQSGPTTVVESDLQRRVVILDRGSSTTCSPLFSFPLTAISLKSTIGS